MRAVSASSIAVVVQFTLMRPATGQPNKASCQTHGVIEVSSIVLLANDAERSAAFYSALGIPLSETRRRPRTSRRD